MYDRAAKTTNTRVSTSNVFIGHHPPLKLEGIQQSETHIHLLFDYTSLLYCTVNKYSMFSWLEKSDSDLWNDVIQDVLFQALLYSKGILVCSMYSRSSFGIRFSPMAKIIYVHFSYSIKQLDTASIVYQIECQIDRNDRILAIGEDCFYTLEYWNLPLAALIPFFHKNIKDIIQSLDYAFIYRNRFIKKFLTSFPHEIHTKNQTIKYKSFVLYLVWVNLVQ